MKVGYLGPKGTFSEYGAYEISKNYKECELVPFKTIPDVIFATESGEIDEGVVPFENSIEGTVTATIDALIFDVELYLKTELVIPVSQNLMVKKGTKELSLILSHPQGISQCSRFLREHYHNVLVKSVSSTAEAARLVSESDGSAAAIAHSRAAEIYGLDIIRDNIQDDSHNQTRFVVLTKKRPSLADKGFKTSLVFSTENKPGELYRILDIMSIWDINMTKIESRPMKNCLGKYLFFVDVESQDKKDLSDAMTMIERKCSYFKYLGTYPVFVQPK